MGNLEGLISWNCYFSWWLLMDRCTGVVRWWTQPLPRSLRSRAVTVKGSSKLTRGIWRFLARDKSMKLLAAPESARDWRVCCCPPQESEEKRRTLAGVDFGVKVGPITVLPPLHGTGFFPMTLSKWTWSDLISHSRGNTSLTYTGYTWSGRVMFLTTAWVPLMNWNLGSHTEVPFLSQSQLSSQIERWSNAFKSLKASSSLMSVSWFHRFSVASVQEAMSYSATLQLPSQSWRSCLAASQPLTGWSKTLLISSVNAW